jgi:hypothetical protein
MSCVNHAIVLPGLLRCVDNIFTDFMDTTIGAAKIFIITERACKGIADVLVDRYQALCYFTEDLDLRFGIKSDSVPSQLRQFIKLEYALRVVNEWETREAQEFDYIHKFRTDLLYDIAFQDYIEPLFSQTFGEQCLLNQHDCNFSGKRSDVMSLSGISAFIDQFMNDESFFKAQLSLVNAQALRAGDVGPFANAFPVGILKHETDIESFHETIRIAHNDYIDASMEFSARLAEQDVSNDDFRLLRSDSILSRTFLNRYYPFHPEHMYARYLNSIGFSTKKYANSWLPLRHSRFAVTEFTKLICDQIQVGDYSFLNDNLLWEIELTKFKASGGNEVKLIQAFMDVELSNISDDQCSSLYEILKLMDCSCIFKWWPQFIVSVEKRGLGVPLCLQKPF